MNSRCCITLTKSSFRRLLRGPAYRSLRLIIVAVLTLGIFSAAGSGPALAQTSPATLSDAALENMTHSLAGLLARYQQADANEKAQFEEDLINLAADRQQVLLSLIEDSPGKILRLALPRKLSKGLPDKVLDHLEQHVELEGELEVSYEDYADGRHKLRHILQTKTDRIELQLAEHARTMQSGMRVRARGWLFKHGGETVGSLVMNDSPNSLELLADGATTTTTSVSTTTTLPNTLGKQDVLVLLVNFQDNPVQPWTPQQAEEMVFGTVNDYYQENSNGKTLLSGDVYGYYTLPIDATCDSWAIHVNAQQAAEAQGVDLSAYNRMVYIFPEISSCGWTGKGTLGGTVSLAWINGSLSLRTVGHELGHNFGLHHAEQLECGSDIIGDNCISITYGDSLDIMGESGVTGHFNSFNKELLGWLTSASGEVITAGGDGSYLLEPYETAPMGAAKGLKVLRGIDSSTGKQLWYYLEYRQALGFDSFLDAKPGITNGVVLRLATESDIQSSQMLDMTPASTRYDLDDAALLAGRSYSDPDAGVTITTEWADATGASVHISFSEQSCIPANPILSLSPDVSTWVAAGSAVMYTATVTNQASLGCAASDFSVTAELPTGWVADSASLNLAPGASGTVSLSVSSAEAATDGFYDIPISAINSNDSNYHKSAVVTYVVDTPTPVCIAANPVLSLSAVDGQAVAAGTTVTYSGTLTNQDSGSCGASVFNVAASVPVGWSASSVSVGLAPGDSATVNVSVTSVASAAGGVYAIGIRAENSADGSYYSSAAATYDVMTPVVVCKAANPLLSLSVSSGAEVSAGTTVLYSGSLTNQDGSGCAASNFAVFADIPAGWSASSTNVNLAPGASAPVTLSITSAVGVAAGAYSINVNADNVADTSYGDNATVRYLVAAPLNSAPRAMDDTVVMAAKMAIRIDVLANDTDPDGDTLTVIQVTQGAMDSVQISGDGSLLYTPAKSFKGSDSFSYTISDGEKTASAIVDVSLVLVKKR